MRVEAFADSILVNTRWTGANEEDLACVLVQVAGSGSTTRHAPTNPSGGGQTAIDGGCSVFFPIINTVLHFDTALTLNVSSNGAGNVTFEYDGSLTNVLLPVLADAAEYGGLGMSANQSDAAPSQAINGANPAAIGQTIRGSPDGDKLTFRVARGSILGNTVGVAPSSFQDVNVNWAGDFALDFTLGGPRSWRWTRRTASSLRKAPA